MDYKDRYIGSYQGPKNGPLVIALSGVHGNEIAGVRAVEFLLKMLEVEPITNPDFIMSGKFVGLKGNLPGLQAGSRYIDVDLNRIWSLGNVRRIRKSEKDNLLAEEGQLLELDTLIRQEIEAYKPEQVVVIDLHTTSADGGIFTIVPDTPEAIDIAVGMFAPVIKGMQMGIHGTTMDYFIEDNFGLPITCIAFEAGQHDDPMAINMCIAAIINCLRSLGCVKVGDVENRHDDILKDYSKKLPKLAELTYCYYIQENEEFDMNPGFKNFEKIIKNQWLAVNSHGKILAEEEGFMLMPRYQKQGRDGFFIIKELAY